MRKKLLFTYKTKNLFNFISLRERNKLILVLIISLISFFLAGLSFFYYIKSSYYFEKQAVNKIRNSPRQQINHFDYKIVLVGDSMTEYLGNLEELNYFLQKHYPNKNFLLPNYGYSSTNLLTLQDRIEKDSTHSGRVFQAINNIDFDLILIESFGENPLSQYPLGEGLKKQNEILDKVVEQISQKHPRSSIVFVATIAPNSKIFGKNSVALTPPQRQQWVDERISYIKNHLAYANSHEIPIINIFEKSLDFWGNGNSLYISKEDNIHPSPTGIFFISQQIADFIYQKSLLPKR